MIQKAMDNARRIFGEDVEYAGSVEKCLKDSECAIIVTEWDEFRKLKPEDFIRFMKIPAVVDGRRMHYSNVYSRMLELSLIDQLYDEVVGNMAVCYICGEPLSLDTIGAITMLNDKPVLIYKVALFISKSQFSTTPKIS